ncbi:MAG: hypothetical protein K9K76_09725 [Halanaerobiales bacterium]|nr:hypothetical protein [Halanaerobiales bacterium]
MQLEYLPITKSKNKKDRFIIELGKDNYIFEVYWNPIGKYFAFNMFDVDENSIILGRKITYNINMLDNIIDTRVPDLIILPVDPSVEHKKITYDNFMDSVKCYILSNGGGG